MKMVPLVIEQNLRGLRFRLTRKLPDRHPTEVWPGIEAVASLLRPFAGRYGNPKRYELLVLCAAVRYLKAQTVFEFGTGDGLTTWHLAANGGSAVRIWTLDLPPEYSARPGDYPAAGSYFAGTKEGERIEQLHADSLDFDPQPYRGLIDFCFIDACHAYEHVRRDTESALVMVRPGGVIFWHDYSRWWPGVQRCLDDLSGSLPVFRIPETALAAVCLPE
jgi:predicted O-methyltransferase YrrM